MRKNTILDFRHGAASAIGHLLNLVIAQDDMFLDAEMSDGLEYVRDPDVEWWSDPDFKYEHSAGVTSRWGLYGIGKALHHHVGVEEMREIGQLAAQLDPDNYKRRLNVIGWAWDGITETAGEIIPHSPVTFAPSRRSTNHGT